ncbi:uncharacterized protein palb2 [Aulostomus maculatus]
MDNKMGDIVHCEEQLRTTLHCDDKDKLRRKLALLQREYLRTAQKLQRAERLEAVRKRIIQQNHQDQGDQEEPSEPSEADPGVPEHHGNSPADTENPRRSQVISFLGPSDISSPVTPGFSHDMAGSHRPSPALRLRSRRSRLRWEKRTAEVGKNTDNGEEAQEQSEQVEHRAEGDEEEEEVKSQGTGVVDQSEELFSASESEPPSLLVAQLNTQGHIAKGGMERKEIQEGDGKREKETELRDEGNKKSKCTSLRLTCGSVTLHASGEGEGIESGERNKADVEEETVEANEVQQEGWLFEKKNNEDMEKNGEKEQPSTLGTQEKKKVMGEEGKGGSLLDSCTLVEGLLFPVEYYVRTTRRMTSSQSQPDMQAIILSQLNTGQHRRSRGRAANRHKLNSPRSNQPTQTDSSSLTNIALCAVESQVSETSSELTGRTHSSNDVSQTNTDVFSTPAVAPRPGRGRRGRRGRGRGKPRTPPHSLCPDPTNPALEKTSEDLESASTPVSSLMLRQEANSQKPLLTPERVDLGSDDLQPASTHSTATHPCSEVGGAQSSSASGHLGKVFPIFLKRSGETNRSTQSTPSAESWRSLLLPSSSPVQSSLLPLPSLPPSGLRNNLPIFDIQQDFHLPDDQFASLKLLKLRQVALESGVEHFTPPSYNTRWSSRRSGTNLSSSDPVGPLLVPLSLTPTVESLPQPSKSKLAASQSTDPQNGFIDHKLTDKLMSSSSAAESENNKKQQTETHRVECRSNKCPASMCQDLGPDCDDKYGEQSTETRVNYSPMCVDTPVTLPLALNLTDKEHNSVALGKVNQPAAEEQTDDPDMTACLEDQACPNHQEEDGPVIKTLSSDCPQLNSSSDLQASDAVQGSGQELLHKEDLKEPTERLVGNKNQENHVPHHSIHSQLLLSPVLASAPYPPLSNPQLPSLGLTPHSPLTSSPPCLSPPPIHNPSTQALSPPALSPCPSFTPPPLVSLSSDDVFQRVEVATCLTASNAQGRDRGGQVVRTEDAAGGHLTHTLKAPAGGCLVDACCLLGSEGRLCVAAAGKWAVCLWSLTSASDWTLTHTWTFNEPVINVFPVLDASGLICVTLGQLEIREVRILSCSSFLQVLLYDVMVQAVVGVPGARIVSSSHSASGSMLQVFTLADHGSVLGSRPLACPGVCVGALAPVDGLSDALIGTEEGGHLFVWNLKTGHLLRRIFLGDGLSHTACLRGYSYCGALFVLLQHHFLCSLEEEENKTRTTDDEEKEDKRKKAALFSLVAVNPLSGLSVLATQLYPPKAWFGRLCEADVSSSGVVGLSQSGCVCVWELRHRGGSRMVWAPESEGWQLARWGGDGTLMMGHHSGDVTLHLCNSSQTDDFYPLA